MLWISKNRFVLFKSQGVCFFQHTTSPGGRYIEPRNHPVLLSSSALLTHKVVHGCGVGSKLIGLAPLAQLTNSTPGMWIGIECPRTCIRFTPEHHTSLLSKSVIMLGLVPNKSIETGQPDTWCEQKGNFLHLQTNICSSNSLLETLCIKSCSLFK